MVHDLHDPAFMFAGDATQRRALVTEKVWFITGCSRGFGRIWAEAALRRGDRVAATARDIAQIEPLLDHHRGSALLLPLDVTDRGGAFDAVRAAHDHFGRLDIVVNNAGYALIGAVEEVEEADVRAVVDTNLFGALWVTQAALPIMRDQRAGHIVAVSSQAGLIGEPTLGLYNASKWALEGMMDALSRELEGLGVKVTIVEPGPYATEFGSKASLKVSRELAAYDDARWRLLGSFDFENIGDPTATPEAIFAVVDAVEPPLRLILGKTVLPTTRDHYETRLSTWEAWAPISELAHGTA
jgi:NAD(P)-dependent dehydrogenase (short-subunit alcohol dehydrogenase family)